MIRNRLFHITDVGTSQGDGVDSTLRIIKQYQRLDVDAQVISAGRSPFQVAFVGCTDLVEAAIVRARQAAAVVQKEKFLPLPIALNSAPRNKKTNQTNAKEDFMYRIAYKSGQTFVLYGPEVLKWVLFFCSRQDVVVEKIISIPQIITDTSNGSQFRSAEHLPIVHFLEAQNLLDSTSTRKLVDMREIEEVFTDQDKHILVAPPDEYGNSRVIVGKALANKILTKKKIIISGLSKKSIKIAESLTSVVPGEISIWPSSNYFPNPGVVVLNIGTRWKPNTTQTTSAEVIRLANKFAKEIGRQYKVKL